MLLRELPTSQTLTSLSLILRKVGLYCAWEDTQGWFCPHRDVFIFHLAGRKRRQWWHRKPDSTPTPVFQLGCLEWNWGQGHVRKKVNLVSWEGILRAKLQEMAQETDAGHGQKNALPSFNILLKPPTDVPQF